ncbi:AraC family transcriptional regulator [Egibacter rhizosphaerae]|uniref:AraC family transcriptional regulator n=1 Tax=Egibacter rhizosphaerae TaxID=1670831 RepID=A0A411YCF3_9ACTN|nr:helix-turn-helix domain-containing protein [Egibacter rhizosphaerae]QBI18842.1 AraC family transcriptional regulator [Egibacter rhizosphaerae]
MEQVTEVWFGPPHEALRPEVERYVGYRFAGFPAGLHRGLPSRHLTFIVSLAEPIEVAAMPDPTQPGGSYAAVVGGLQGAPAVVAHDGDQVGIGVELAPTGARALFGMPAGAIASTVVELTDLLGRGVATLPERTAQAGTWGERFAILDEVLVASLRDRTRTPADVAWAWRRLEASGGTVPVGALARELGWSRRHFSERFRRELGLPPKVAAGVLRFDRARWLLGRDDHPDLATVAATCGYADQSHLTRDWNRFAGCPPTVWLAEELPFVQDEPDADHGD